MPDNEATAAVSRSILRASFVVIIAHALVKLLSIVLNRYLGATFGAGMELDVYAVTFQGVIWTVFLVGEEALGPAFLPLFMERKDAADEPGAWRFAATIINVQALLLAVAVALILLFPTQVLAVFTKWLRPESVGVAGVDATARVTLAVRFMRIMAPGLFGLSIASVTYMLLNGYKKFFWAAFGDGTLKLAVLLSALLPALLHLLLGIRSPVNPLYLAIGVLAGSYGKLLTHLPGLARKLRYYRPRIDLSDPQFRRFLALIAPLLVGILYAKVRDAYNNFRVLSDLEPGLIAVNAWGKKIYDTVGYIIPYAVSIAMFPFFCELVDRDDLPGLGRTLTRSLRVVLFLLFPAAIGLAVASVPLARGLYEVQKWSHWHAFLAGNANAMYTLGLPFWAGEMLLMQAFFSSRRMVVPVVAGIVWSTVSMVVSYVGIVRMNLEGMGALLCVAGGFACARVGKTITLAVILGRRVPIFSAPSDRWFFAKLAAVTVLVVDMVWLSRIGCDALLARLYPLGLPFGRKLTLLMFSEVAVCGVAGGIGLVAGGLIFRMEELAAVRRWLFARLRRRQ